jgi:ABC-type sugar transport system ATPase subunit
MNFVRGQVSSGHGSGGGLAFRAGSWTLLSARGPEGVSPGDEVWLGVRAEDCRLATAGGPETGRGDSVGEELLPGRVTGVEPQGAQRVVEVQLDLPECAVPGGAWRVVVGGDGPVVAAGQSIRVGLCGQRVHWFDRQDQALARQMAN